MFGFGGFSVAIPPSKWYVLFTLKAREFLQTTQVCLFAVIEFKVLHQKKAVIRKYKSYCFLNLNLTSFFNNLTLLLVAFFTISGT